MSDSDIFQLLWQTDFMEEKSTSTEKKKQHLISDKMTYGIS